MTKIYAIYDEKLEAYNRPFFLTSDGVAIRAFQDEINNKVDKIEPPDDDFAEIKLPDNEKSIRKNISWDQKMHF